MATVAKGTTVSWDAVELGKVTSISGCGYSVDMVETTTHDSADFFREYQPGFIDADEITVNFDFDYADTTGQIAVEADGRARESKALVVTFPTTNATTWTCTGFVTSFHVDAPDLAGKVEGSITIKPTGKPTFAVAP